MTYKDQYYIDNLNKLHFLSADDHKNASVLNLNLPKSDWIVATTEQVNEYYNALLPDLQVRARGVRDDLRYQIDLLLRPAATVKDVLITDAEKTSLITDSVLLANWPKQSKWPNIPLPTLSVVAQTYLTIPVWPE